MATFFDVLLKLGFEIIFEITKDSLVSFLFDALS